MRALDRKLTVHGLAFFAQQLRELFVHDGFEGGGGGAAAAPATALCLNPDPCTHGIEGFYSCVMSYNCILLSRCIHLDGLTTSGPNLLEIHECNRFSVHKATARFDSATRQTPS